MLFGSQKTSSEILTLLIHKLPAGLSFHLKKITSFLNNQIDHTVASHTICMWDKISPNPPKNLFPSLNGYLTAKKKDEMQSLRASHTAHKMFGKHLQAPSCEEGLFLLATGQGLVAKRKQEPLMELYKTRNFWTPYPALDLLGQPAALTRVKCMLI